MFANSEHVDGGGAAVPERHNCENAVRKRARNLLVKKDSQIAAAETLRKAQIRNANQHYLYELRRVEGTHH